MVAVSLCITNSFSFVFLCNFKIMNCRCLQNFNDVLELRVKSRSITCSLIYQGGSMLTSSKMLCFVIMLYKCPLTVGVQPWVQQMGVTPRSAKPSKL